MARRVFIIVLSLALVAGAGFGVWWWQVHKRGAPANRLTLFGNVDLREVQLAFNDSDRIATMPVKEGAKVHKGELVGTLDRTRALAAVDQARGRVDAEQAVVDRMLAGSRPEQIAKARADVAAARARFTDADQTYHRMAKLFAKHAIAAQDFDHAKAARAEALGQLHSLEQTLKLAVLGPRQEDIDQARATLAADKAALVNAKQVLADTKLYAPADGVIRNRLLEPGDMASPQTPAYTLALTHPLWVRAYVAEADLGKLRLGMKATVTTDSYPGKTYAGRVGYISPTAEFTPKTVETTELRTSLVYEVRIYIDHPRNELRLGMPATVTIDLKQQNAPPAHADRHGT